MTRRVLIVDDDFAVRGRWARQLELGAEPGGVELCRGQGPLAPISPVVVSDLRMPEDGFPLAHARSIDVSCR